MSFLSGPGVFVKNNSPAVDASVDKIHPQLRGGFSALVGFITNALGHGVQLNDGFRTSSQQQARIDAFNSGKAGVFEPAPLGRSTHEGAHIGFTASQALDLSIFAPDGGAKIGFNSQIYTQVGRFWQSRPSVQIGGNVLYPRWGGTFRDPVHFEYSTETPKSIPPPGKEAEPVTATAQKPPNKPTEAAAGETAQIKSGYCP